MQGIKQTVNWKYPGLDKLLSFWIKRFYVKHEEPTKATNDMITNPKFIPALLTSGSIFLLSKGKNTKDSKNYRPITCLPTIYKILKAALTNRINNHLFRRNHSPRITERPTLNV
jgi:hypothetical protein